MPTKLRKFLGETAYYTFITVAVLGIWFLSTATGCASTAVSPQGDTYSTRLHTEPNPYTSPVITDNGGTLTIVKPPALEFTGKTVTGQQIRAWAHANGINATGVYADENYAQLESESAKRLAHWLKRALNDLGFEYYGDARDCDNYARIFRAFPDFFTDDDGAQALVFGIYAKMEHSFAGVTDGYHALNATWTDKGVFVFEPQGWQQLVYQDIRAWPNKGGITSIIAD